MAFLIVHKIENIYPSFQPNRFNIINTDKNSETKFGRASEISHDPILDYFNEIEYSMSSASVN